MSSTVGGAMLAKQLGVRLNEKTRDITTAIEEFFLGVEPFVDGLTIPPRKDRIARSALIGITEDIVSAANGTFTTVTFTPTGLGGSLELYVLGQGGKAKSTGVTYIA